MNNNINLLILPTFFSIYKTRKENYETLKTKNLLGFPNIVNDSILAGGYLIDESLLDKKSNKVHSCTPDQLCFLISFTLYFH